jgi:hypothetical protein
VDDAQLWTGSLTCQLVDAEWRPSGAIEFVLAPDFVTAWRDDRKLAMIDRERFRSWFTDTEAPFQRHDLTFGAVNGWIGVASDEGPALWLVPDDAARLRAAV